MAPVISPAAVPSTSMVSESVVHTDGPIHCTNGQSLTTLGAGTPGRPPAVWVNRTRVAVTSAEGRSSGNAVGWNATLVFPNCISVGLM